MRAERKAEAFRLLGLARRAGAVVPGTDAARRAVRKGEARLILMAGDASRVQLDKIRRLVENRSIPRAILGDRATLGAAVGVGPVSAVAVTMATFAEELRLRLEPDDDGVTPDDVEE